MNRDEMKVWTTYKVRIRKALDAYADLTDLAAASQLAVHLEKKILELVLLEKGYLSEEETSD